MRSRILTMSLAVATLALTGCSKDEKQPTDPWNGEIRLSSGVSVQTRASFGQDDQLASGQQIAVFVDKATTTPVQLYGNNVLKANGSGGLTEGTAMYYPAGEKVDVYAFHPSSAITGSDYPTTITHAVNADQSTDTKYLASDLLYAASKDNDKKADAIVLKFYHLLSKVEVALKSGNGTPDLTDATVTIEGTQLKATFTPDKAADINSSTAATAETARAGMITVSTDDNNAASITIGTKITANDFSTGTEYAEAVIVPQTVATNTEFIKVRLANGGPTYTYKLDAETEFKSGKKYQYKITVNNTGLTVSSSIESWGSGGNKTGTAEME